MEMDGLVNNTGGRAIGMLMFGSEMVGIVQELRWMLLALVIFIIADFRFGWGESNKHYTLAKEAGNRTLMDKYKWRTSRALRRTINKAIDYLMWLAIGVVFGMSLLEPVGIAHIYGAVAAMFVAWLCELKSIIGHFFYLRGVSVEKNTINGFFKAFAIALAKRKDEDVGEALKEAFDEGKKEEKNE